MSKTLTMLLVLGVAISSEAQVALPSSQVAVVNKIFDSRPKQNSLRCDVRQWSPSLDFDFRYQTGFVISSSLGQFTPGEELTTYLRVSPQARPAVLLQKTYGVPQVQSDMAKGVDSKTVGKLDLTMSGAWNIGEGRYEVELLLLDTRGRTCYQRWSLQAAKPKKEVVPIAQQPQTVAPLIPESWDGTLDPNGIRLTVLLDAAPMNPYAVKLYAWDRILLLQGLTSLLKHLPCRSVRVVAFNLDQQQEVFRQDRFDSEGFRKLATTLETFKPATIPYQALQRGRWLKFLGRLAQEQASASDPSDAVVFLGPTTHFDKEVPMEPLERTSSPFFYFEFYRSRTHFPDAIDHLTKELHGTVFHIDSADEFALAINKMLAELKAMRSGERVLERR